MQVVCFVKFSYSRVHVPRSTWHAGWLSMLISNQIGSVISERAFSVINDKDKCYRKVFPSMFFSWLPLPYMYMYIMYIYYAYIYICISIYLSVYLFIYLTYNSQIIYKQDITDSCLTWIRGVPLFTYIHEITASHMFNVDFFINTSTVIFY